MALGAAPAAPDLKEDPPPAAKPTAGDISGTISAPEKVASLSAVSRVTEKTYTPDKFDRATGRFLFKNLPGAARYDLCLTLSDDRRIEGIDLDFVDSCMLALASQRRKELGMPPEESHAFGQQDVQAMLDYVNKLDDFLDIRRPLYIQGHGLRATMLIELMRTREFYSSGGGLIWRVELWYFEYRHGGWERLANQERVLRRERIEPAGWRKISVEYRPELSVPVARDGTSKPVDFNIPDKPDPARGRPADSAPDIQTKPILLGMDEPTTSQPASRPLTTSPSTNSR